VRRDDPRLQYGDRLYRNWRLSEAVSRRLITESIMPKIIISSAASERLSAATGFLSGFPNLVEIFVVGATRAAADDFVREYSSKQRATFGLHRFSLVQLAARISALRLAANGQVPCSALSMEATVMRAVHESHREGALQYFSPVALLPGFARAVRATASELRAAGIAAAGLENLPPPGPDVSRLLAAIEGQLAAAQLVDLAALMRTAASVVRNNELSLANASLLLLDVAIHSKAEYELIEALVSRSPQVLVTVPTGDEKTVAAIEMLPIATKSIERFPTEESALGRLRQYLFSEVKPPSGNRDDQVRMFSAPGEGRECVEIARRILEEAGNGLRFDQVAVFLRSPSTYSGLLDSAFRRAGIPAFFSLGTSRPDPAGRAFLALLACADEKLSAKRFAEYLSLGQVPALDEAGGPPKGKHAWTAAQDEMMSLGLAAPAPEDSEPLEKAADDADSDDSPQIGGTLRAPWNWEKLLVDAAVIGGKDRWERRLNGLDAEFHLKLREVVGKEPESPKAVAIQREIRELSHLKKFALPLIEVLSGFPREAHWGEWLTILQSLAPTVLRNPERVLSMLAEMTPMESVGPVSLFEVRNVLLERLSTLEVSPPDYRYGHVFVATTGQARGYAFEVVFLPGLAEQIFPQRPREDPILLDTLRGQLNSGLRNQAARVSEERLLLRLCVGSARKRLYLSYPRLDVVQARPRVPSFYALDVDRAITGEVPRIETLEYKAGEEGGARLAWPAPTDPNRSIDAVEHDLSVLGSLLNLPPNQSKGRARYLLELNENMARSLRTRFARWHRPSWSKLDGFCAPAKETIQLLSEHRLTVRPYSASSLQRFAACPYQFYLAAVEGIEPRKEAVSIEQMDPLTRGSILHRVQAEFLRQLLGEGKLPISPTDLSLALERLNKVIQQIEEEYREILFPAILRVWNDEIEGLRTDLHLWVKRMAENPSDWIPAHFELSFGLSDGLQRDPSSVADVAVIAGGFKLRGIVDLIERRSSDGNLRVTDYKSGKDRTVSALQVGGGEVLQPTLYSLAVESFMKQPVIEGRLYYCTSAGGFAERIVPLAVRSREAAEEVLKIIDSAVERAFFPPAPREKACEWCDFQVVCGPYEEIRVKTKDQKSLSELMRLRGLQ
jgi:ATP-dependent helicase/nuclease subunit B